MMSDTCNNEKSYFEDIICARATPVGSSAIAVIRVTGKNSWSLLDKIFISSKKTTKFESHKLYYGKIKFEEKIIDTVLVSTFSETKSFTGEESFEINCHGSEVIVSLIIKALISSGARIAEPGEFSKRAFLNGKIDLVEAEAIADLINASTKESANAAANQLTGRLTREINQIKDILVNVLTEIEAFIDYPEEDLSIDEKRWITYLSEAINLTSSLLKGFERGRFFRESIGAVIAGRTNSGKSTLFNFLVNEDKAIVSDIHGTTRDYLDAVINISGYAVRLYDTAGLRDTDDPIEKEGTKRTKQLIDKNSMVIYTISAMDGLTDDDIKNLMEIENEKKLIIVINKIDISKKVDDIINKINNLNIPVKNYQIVKMSALTRVGIDEFNSSFIKLLLNETTVESTDALLTNERHALLLKDAEEQLINAVKRLTDALLDLAAFDLREALNKLGEITGEVTPEDIINRIFSNFCVGK